MTHHPYPNYTSHTPHPRRTRALTWIIGLLSTLLGVLLIMGISTLLWVIA